MKAILLDMEAMRREMQLNFQTIVVTLNNIASHEKENDGGRGVEQTTKGRNKDQNSLNLLLAELPKNFKIEFSRFDGNNPRSWISKCNKFFNFNPISDESKMSLAQIYLDDKMDQWFQGYQRRLESSVGLSLWMRSLLGMPLLIWIQ